MTTGPKKNSFVLHKDSLSILTKLSDEQAGKLFKAIFEYQTQDILPTDNLISIIFESFLNQFKRDVISYEKVCDRNRANIAKRWNKKIPNDTKNTTGKSGIPNDTKNTDSDSDSDSDIFSNENINISSNEDISLCKKDLQNVLEKKLNRKLNTKTWAKDFAGLLKDLSKRSNAIEDIKKAIAAIDANFGDKYFPVIQSAGALREKFSKVEAAIQRNSKTQYQPFADQDYSAGTEGFKKY